MNPLLAKEIRLLLPTYGLALLLAVLPVWLLPIKTNDLDLITVALYLFGAVMLALSSFGREFGLNTFPLLLTQPLDRTRIWRTKVAVLGCAIATTFGAWWLSSEFCLLLGLGDSILRATVLMAGMATVATFAGGLWTTLLLRQITAAFWFTTLVPAAIAAAIVINGGGKPLIYAALSLYGIAGFLWARRQFSRAQEVAWTGGVITFGAGRAAEAAERAKVRIRRPLAALFRKELQLHQVGLMGMAGLFVLHLAIVLLRKTSHKAFGELLSAGLDSFGVIWVVVPLFAGSVSVAEERKLGTMEGQLCLAISSRWQFAVKLLFVVMLGGLLSATLLWTVEGIAAWVGAGSQLNVIEKPFSGTALADIFFQFSAISVIAFYASTLTRNVLQSLAMAAPMGLLFAVTASVRPAVLFGIQFWRGELGMYIEWVVMLRAMLWLAYGNFRRLSEPRRFWLRNIAGLMAASVFVVAFTSALYNRVWELFTPLEPAHGPARLTGAKPATLHAFNNVLEVLLPDGRLWVDTVGYRPGSSAIQFGEETWIDLGGKWTSLIGRHFVEGSNWVNAAPGVWETVGLRADGTLWVSEKPVGPSRRPQPPRTAPEKLVRIGEETNWLNVVRDSHFYSVLLLKTDGTLWRWGTNHWKQAWPGLRSFVPQPIVAEHDWASIVSAGSSIYAWKQNGEAWIYDSGFENHPRLLQRWPGFDKTKWRSLSQVARFQAGVREDGTAWLWGLSAPPSSGEEGVQIGHGSDWVAVALSRLELVGLKADGSLWQWNFGYSQNRRMWFPGAPVRLGTHHDWVAVGHTHDGIFSLAADGSLWCWWDRDSYSGALLATSRRPTRIENIFDQVE